jgi:hypothetical protein
LSPLFAPKSGQGATFEACAIRAGSGQDHKNRYRPEQRSGVPPLYKTYWMRRLVLFLQEELGATYESYKTY